jgi:hypothetical protein
VSENTVTIRGVDGRLYWGYFLVGTVRAWTATRGASGPGTLTATIDHLDTVRASQHPIVFVPHKDRPWRWALESLQIADGMISASIRLPES